MKITIFSVLMAVLWSSVLILVTHLLRKKRFFLDAMGLPVLFTFYLLCILRMGFPVEFSFVQEISLRGWFSQILDHFYFDTKTWSNFEWSWAGVAGVLWAVVSVVLTASFLTQYVRTIRKISNGHSVCDNEAEIYLAELQKGKKRRMEIQVFRCSQVRSPMGLGLLKRKILLPEGAYSKRELSYILLHEYTHFLQHDLLVKMVTQLYCCLFWWNPLVYLLRKDIAQILELKCDVTVTKSLSNPQKAEYLETILLVLKMQAGDAPYLPLATRFLQSQDSLSLIERFTLIATERTPHTAVTLSLLLGALSLFLASYLFIFQSAYNPPAADIYSSENIVVPNFGEVYLSDNGDGTYTLIPENGTPIVINDPTALDVLRNGGIPVIKSERNDSGK